jgi:outer membrane protein assembly factor BamD
MMSLPGAFARLLRSADSRRAAFAALGRFSAVLSLGVVVAGLLVLPGCSAGKDKENYVERPVDNIYNNAMALMKREKYKKAAKEFEEVERQHPYSTWASRALVMAAYSYYEANKYDEAILAAKRYIALHPGGADAAYANYLVAASQYEQITDVGRDQKVTREALKSREEVVR